MMVRISLALLLAWSLGGCNMLVGSFELTDGSTHDGDVSLVNGRISIGRECTVSGSLSSVNGAIEIGGDSSVGGVDNVNGSIEIADRVSVDGNVDSVNGRVTVGSGVRIAGDLDTVNGRIRVGEQSVISGDVSSVNGGIEMTGAQAEAVESVNSPIELLAGTRITGALTVRKPSGISFGNQSRPRVIIGAGSSVAGPLTFEQEVELYVHETATVGDIEGAEPISFSGDSP